MTPGRWFAVIVVAAIALTWLNYAYRQHRLAVLGFPLSTKVITNAPPGESARFRLSSRRRLA